MLKKVLLKCGHPDDFLSEECQTCISFTGLIKSAKKEGYDDCLNRDNFFECTLLSKVEDMATYKLGGSLLVSKEMLITLIKSIRQ